MSEKICRQFVRHLMMREKKSPVLHRIRRHSFAKKLRATFKSIYKCRKYDKGNSPYTKILLITLNEPLLENKHSLAML